MKKIIIFIILYFVSVPLCHAQNLNFRIEKLDYEYKIGDEIYNFKRITNNETERLLYTLSPLENPEFFADYLEKTNDLNSFDLEIQNKIKTYIRASQNIDPTQDDLNLSFINTQLLIWKIFHPEIEIELMQGYEIKSYEERININHRKPDWISDYEIWDELVLPKNENYQIESHGCDFETNETSWIFSKCQKDAFVLISEIELDNLKFYAIDNLTKFIESANAPRTWKISISKIENNPSIPPNKEENESLPAPPMKDEDQKPSISNDTPCPEKPTEETGPYETIFSENPISNEKIKINNVPNTFENQPRNFLLLSFLGILIPCSKKSKYIS